MYVCMYVCMYIDGRTLSLVLIDPLGYADTLTDNQSSRFKLIMYVCTYVCSMYVCVCMYVYMYVLQRQSPWVHRLRVETSFHVCTQPHTLLKAS